MGRFFVHKDSSDVSNNFFTDQMGEQVSWIPWWIGLVRVDGTDFWICEPKPFAKDISSHKFVKAGLCYEVGVCVQTGLIVWINGPFAAGKYNDITFF